MKKYELTQNTKIVNDITLYQIKALINIPKLNINIGDLGGWIENERNLSHEGDAWVSGNAWVYGDACIYSDAMVCGDARVCGDAWVSGNAMVYGDASIYGNARVCGNAMVCGNAKISKTSDYMTISSLGENNRTITITFSDKKISAGCFHGYLNEFKTAVDNKYNGKGNYYPVIKLIKELFGNSNFFTIFAP